MIVIGVTLHVPSDEFEAFRPAIEALITASRAEPGVMSYSFAIDVVDPELIRIFEIYTDRAALDRHMASAHFQNWRSKSTNFARKERWVLDANQHSEGIHRND